MNIGYACVPHDAPGEKEAAKLLIEFGAEKVFIDTKSRTWRDDGLLVGAVIRPGDTFILLSAEGLVDQEEDMDGNPKSYRRMKAQFRKVLKPIGQMGIPLRIRDGEPRIYSTNDDIEAFIDVAVEERHRRLSQDGGRGEKRKPGRPIKYFATDEQKKAICLMWWDKSIDRETVRRNASEMVGWTVTDNVVKSWCGVKREKPDG